jgi:hypothetical protein
MNKDSHLIREKDFKLQNRVYKCSHSSYKPNGLWYQINDSWEEWCKYEMPQWLGAGSRASHKINLEIDKTNVLVIQTLEEFDSFHNKYCSLHPFLNRSTYINWERVSEDYDGIEITNYLYERRHDSNSEWYYTWDIASGCIWNTDIIKMIGEPIEIEKPENKWETWM